MEDAGEQPFTGSRFALNEDGREPAGIALSLQKTFDRVPKRSHRRALAE